MLIECEVAMRAAREAGSLLLQNFRQSHQVSYKGSINLVTEMDKRSEKMIARILSNEFPGYGFVGEESFQERLFEQEHWIVDPLDGTTNYARGYPFFAVSIALVKNGEVLVGVVYNPLSDEMFTAVRGGGALLNGHPVHVSETHCLGEALVASGFPYDAWENPADNTEEWRRLIKRVISVRCDGSAALDLCSVAVGRFDGYWELELEPWDLAAGALIVQEAGGILSSVCGKPFHPYQRNLVASNGALHPDLLKLLNTQPSNPKNL